MKIWISASILAVLCIAAFFSTELARYAYDAVQVGPSSAGPSSSFWFGTDILGRDLFSRILVGARLSLAVGFSTALVSLILGSLVGLVSGYFGGRIDRFCMAVADMLLTFPMLLLAILITLLVGRGVMGIFISIAATSWVQQARLVRGLTLQARGLLYVESARAVGVSTFGILLRHIFPNLLGPIFVSLTFQIPTNIMTESFLSFVGLGIEPPLCSWGSLANEGYQSMQSYPHLILFPGFALFITMIALNMLGDGLRDYYDPKSKSGLLI